MFEFLKRKPVEVAKVKYNVGKIKVDFIMRDKAKNTIEFTGFVKDLDCPFGVYKQTAENVVRDYLDNIGRFIRLGHTNIYINTNDVERIKLGKQEDHFIEI